MFIDHWSIIILNEILQFVNDNNMASKYNNFTFYTIFYKNFKKGIDFIIKIWHNNFR